MALTFRSWAGSLQVEIGSFDDLVEASRMPAALWVATACPTDGFSCDPRLLELLDRDRNGRVRVEELRVAIDFVARMLKDRKGVDQRADVLQLDALSKDGAPLAEAARIILAKLGSEKGASISLAQLRESDAKLREKAVNGDGIIAPASIADEPLQKLCRLVLESGAAKTNRAGLAGVDPGRLAAFREQRTAALAHLDAKGAAFSWGAESPARAAQVLAVEERLREWFLRSRLVATQAGAADSLRLPGARIEATVSDRKALLDALEAASIAPLRADGVLPFDTLVRGASYESLQSFRQDVAAPAGHAERLEEAAFEALVARARAVGAWQQRADAEPLCGKADEARAIEPEALDRLEQLCKEDLALAPTIAAIVELERLVLYQRWLLALSRNFISMAELYDRERPALFERGRLVLDGRVFSFSVRVPDRAAHVALAEQNTLCTAYVRVQSSGPTDAPYEVAVPITAGRSAGIVAGKRGIFIDVNGRELDATVVHVVRHPVSLWEAATAPFTRIGRFLAARIEALAASGEKGLDAGLEKSWAVTAATASAASAPPPKAPEPKPADAGGGAGGMIAAGGLAIAAIGSSLAFIVGQLRELSLMDVVTALLVLVALVSGPAALLGWLKLRRRSLATVLEGAGWALNDRLLLSRDLGRLFTRRPAKPKGSKIERLDLVRAQGEQRAARGEDEEEESHTGRVVFAVVTALLVVVLWQEREFVTAQLRRFGVLRPIPVPTAPAPAPQPAPVAAPAAAAAPAPAPVAAPVAAPAAAPVAAPAAAPVAAAVAAPAAAPASAPAAAPAAAPVAAPTPAP